MEPLELKPPIGCEFEIAMSTTPGSARMRRSNVS